MLVLCHDLCRAVCSGLLPSLIGVAHVAIQFPLYEAIKNYMAGGDSEKVGRLKVTQLVSFPL